MALSIHNKQAIVTKVSEISKNALSMVIANYRGISVNKINELRKTARSSGVYTRIVRNTLLSRIVNGTQFECIKDMFSGPTMIAYSVTHPGIAARLFKDFAKVNKKFEIKAAAFQGKLITSDNIDYLATMPTYEEALVRLILIIKEASIGKLIRTIAAIRNIKK